jgi:hypothetical protein
MIRGWWAGFRYWSEAATASSLAIITMPPPAGFPDAVRRLRRGLRDVRDRIARRRRSWRDVGFARLMGGDHTAMVVVSHEGVSRREVLGVLRRRWPHVYRVIERRRGVAKRVIDDPTALPLVRP